ncbi:la-related protein 4 isoform X2 [Neocloeon triangulifer]|uniref:la-related protein 4 isoform X2 n=1 Tax=Neocloeon triangulifer TaxID=2078957 RepID=UPI00286EE675|nr:la-related protein 4 isoform X2 [Neocloeon triangulifer]
MPNTRAKTTTPAVTPFIEPIAAYLDANGTYVCTAFNPRCFVVQKVTSGVRQFFPDQDKLDDYGTDDTDSDSPDTVASNSSHTEGYVYMNGDIEKIPSGVAFAAPTPDLQAAGASESDRHLVNGDDAMPTGAAASGQSPNTANMTAAELEQLKQLLATQLEYYFSRENLASDTYLLSQMDNDQYVPIWTVANFNQVKKLTTDIKLITDVLRESSIVQVDEEGLKVRPNHKRCIVILREVSENTPAEEIEGLFSSENCPKCVSCEFAHNNAWYVTFESDEDAQRAYRFLREEVREFQGKPIMARIKAKPMNRLPMNNTPSSTTGPKNGFRSPPVYETARTFTPTMVYANGTSASTLNFPNAVQIIYPPQQPTPQPSFGYTPPMIPWPPSHGQPYYDIGSVFTVNGLAPQSPFPKPPSSKFNTRSKKRPPTSSSLPDTSRVATIVTPLAAAPVVMPKTALLDSRQDEMRADEDRRGDKDATGSLRQRRRRKEDDVRAPSGSVRAMANSPQPVATPVASVVQPGPKFDLEATAFPPLPGLDQESSTKAPAPEQLETSASPSPWESRLSDVVKGTAKAKVSTSSSRDKDLPAQPEVTATPPPPPTPTAASVVSSAPKTVAAVAATQPKVVKAAAKVEEALTETPPTPVATPPNFPEKSVKSMADKSTKTDDALLNGEVSGSTAKSAPEATRSMAAAKAAPPAPVMANASTMTNPIEKPSSNNNNVNSQDNIPNAPSPPPGSKLSYAQVAQHHREKQMREERSKSESEGGSTTSSNNGNKQPELRDVITSTATKEGIGQRMGRGGGGRPNQQGDRGQYHQRNRRNDDRRMREPRSPK